MSAELLLRADDISYTQGGRLILDRISFELRRSQITTIIGPNGAGKSTLANVVNASLSAARICASATCRKRSMSIR